MSKTEVKLFFVIHAKTITPEDFVCNVAATCVPPFAREHAKEIAL